MKDENTGEGKREKEMFDRPRGGEANRRREAKSCSREEMDK